MGAGVQGSHFFQARAELADGGSLGRVHIELGPEEVLPFPLPWQCATFLYHSQPDHSRRSRQKGRLAGLASERVPEVPFPLELWVRISPFRFFLKSSTLPPLWVAADP